PGSSGGLTNLLRTCGYEVVETPDGLAALRLAAEQPPDVILLDLSLPGLDGVEVARRVRAMSWEERPLVVALTGYGGDADRERALAGGVDLHLVKPADPVALIGLLGRFHRVIAEPADGDGPR